MSTLCDKYTASATSTSPGCCGNRCGPGLKCEGMYATLLECGFDLIVHSVHRSHDSVHRSHDMLIVGVVYFVLPSRCTTAGRWAHCRIRLYAS